MPQNSQCCSTPLGCRLLASVALSKPESIDRCVLRFGSTLHGHQSIARHAFACRASLSPAQACEQLMSGTPGPLYACSSLETGELGLMNLMLLFSYLRFHAASACMLTHSCACAGPVLLIELPGLQHLPRLRVHVQLWRSRWPHTVCRVWGRSRWSRQLPCCLRQHLQHNGRWHG